MAVDADASDAPITVSRTVVGRDGFDVSINVTSAVEPYSAYRFRLEWNPAILSFVAGSHLEPSGFSACFPFDATSADVGTACSAPEGATSLAGQADRLTFKCIASGTTLLHLVTMAEDPRTGATTVSATGDTIETVTADASVTCQ